jgi:hypothetical protein
MKAIKATMVLLIVAMVGVAVAQDKEAASMHDQMELGQEHLQQMLSHLLLDDDYESIVQGAEMLTKHAKEIRASKPSQWAEPMPKGEFFENYALHLESSSRNLKVVVEEMQRERAAGKKGSEYLRPNAAVFFGQAVTMCVNCHNKFRTD